MSSPEDQWLDHDAGPVVRPYALTGGRTRPSGESFDLIAVVSVVAGLPSDPPGLEPEHVQVLHRCRTPTSVADTPCNGVPTQSAMNGQSLPQAG